MTKIIFGTTDPTGSFRCSPNPLVGYGRDVPPAFSSSILGAQFLHFSSVKIIYKYECTTKIQSRIFVSPLTELREIFKISANDIRKCFEIYQK